MAMGCTTVEATHHGMQLLLGNRFAECDSFLKQQRDLLVDGAPGRVKIIVGIAFTRFLTGAATFGKVELEDSLKCLWEAEAVARKTPTLEGKVVQAETHLLGALIQIAQERLPKAALNLHKSKVFFNDAAKLMAQGYDGVDRNDLQSSIDFGQGAFALFVSILPPTVVFIAGIVGFTGDRESGLALLSTSQNSGDLMSPFAGLCLLAFYLSISVHIGAQTSEHLCRAEQIIAWADERSPRSFFFQYFKARLLRQRSLLDEAIEALNVAMSESGDVPAFRQLIFNDLGWVNLIKLDFAASAYNFKMTVVEGITKESNMRSYFTYNHGISLFCSGATEEALECFRAVPTMISGKKKALHRYVIRKSSQFDPSVATGGVLDMFELLCVWNNFQAMGPDAANRALDLLNQEHGKFAATKWQLSDQLRYHSYRAYILSVKGAAAEAERAYQVVFEEERVLDARGKSDGVLAMAWMAYALWKVKQGDLEMADAAHDRAKSYKGFELHELLALRLYSINETIKTARKAAQ